MTAFARLRTLLAYARLRRHYGKRVGWPTCGEIVGWGSYCDGGQRPMRCHEPVSRLRWVLVGRCGQHGGRA